MQPAYAQLSSLQNQIPSSSNGIPIGMVIVHEMKNFELGPKKESLFVKEDGVYFPLALGKIAVVLSPPRRQEMSRYLVRQKRNRDPRLHRERILGQGDISRACDLQICDHSFRWGHHLYLFCRKQGFFRSGGY